ncbi:hypothetical protein CI1B_70990 [Bradyrhizobium ivorense]|uniref:DUF2380 domain-containing protein n=1 Tax=Bradyrhizobium ivorense TaxID=2511166 RepID=A0A508TUK7_9BRAD|nr:DUF2380 domain-containing protein [Bradyrhizobium ivorense]VIO77916.1 hypothetical protein CI1B_70990 [Bradyrhizobium ivorense]
MRRTVASLQTLCAVLALCLCPATTWPASPVAVAIADFDYVDTSGEPNDQVAKHTALVTAFGEHLRRDLGGSGDYRVQPVACAQHPCTAGSMPADDFAAAARQSGAQFVVYGGIRKMSTLVQWGEVQLVDIKDNKLLLQRTVTFRGDTDEAFRRAAGFVSATLREALPRP